LKVVRPIIFIIISCCAHLLLLQFDVAQQAIPKSAQRYGVKYVIRTAEQFVVAASQPSVVNAHTGKAGPETCKPLLKPLVEQVTEPLVKLEKKSLLHKPLVEKLSNEAVAEAKPAVEIKSQPNSHVEKQESVSKTCNYK